MVAHCDAQDTQVGHPFLKGWLKAALGLTLHTNPATSWGCGMFSYCTISVELTGAWGVWPYEDGFHVVCVYDCWEGGFVYLDTLHQNHSVNRKTVLFLSWW